MSVSNDSRFVIAYYGFSLSIEDIESCYRTVVDWFTRLGFIPNQLGVGRHGRGAGRMGEFSRANQTLLRKGFADVVSFDMNAGLPNASVPGLDFYASSIFHNQDGSGYFVASVPTESVPKMERLRVSKEIATILSPSYGIGFERELKHGPIWYALGVNVDPGSAHFKEEHEERRSISRWGDLGMVREVYRDGLLRDIYEWNFLSKDQLSRPVGSVTFKSWILENRTRGVLSHLTKTISLWEVEESRIPDLRCILHDAGAIFDWRKFIKKSR